MDFSLFPSADNLDYQNIILSNGISSYFVGWTDERFSNSYYNNAKFIPNDSLEQNDNHTVNKTYLPVYKDCDLVFDFDPDASEKSNYNSSYFHKDAYLEDIDILNINVSNAERISGNDPEDTKDSLFKGSFFYFSSDKIFMQEDETSTYSDLSVIGNGLNYIISDNEIFDKLSPINESGYTSIFIGTIDDFNTANGFKIGETIRNAKIHTIGSINKIVYSESLTDIVTVNNSIFGAIQSNTSYPFSTIEIFQRTKLNPYKIDGENKSAINIGESISNDQFITRESFGSNDNLFLISQSDNNNRIIFNNSDFKINLDDSSIVDKTVFIARALKTTRLSNGNYQCSLSSYFRTVAEDQLSVITDTITVSQEVMNAIMAENDASKNLLIGVSPAAYLTFFNGNIKRLSLFKRALSFDEINDIATDLSVIIDTSKIREVRFYKEEDNSYFKQKIASSDNYVKIINAVRNHSYIADNLTLNAKGLSINPDRSSIDYSFPDTTKITGIEPGISILNYYMIMEKPRTINFYNNSTLVKTIKIKDVSTSFTVPSEIENIENYQGLSRTSSTSSIDYPRGEAVSVTSGTSTLKYYIVTLLPRTINYIAKYGNQTTIFKTDTVLENVTSLTIPNDVKNHTINNYKLTDISLNSTANIITGTKSVLSSFSFNPSTVGSYTTGTIEFKLTNSDINSAITIPTQLSISKGTTELSIYCHYKSLSEISITLPLAGSISTSNNEFEAICYKLNPSSNSIIPFIALMDNDYLAINNNYDLTYLKFKKGETTENYDKSSFNEKKSDGSFRPAVTLHDLICTNTNPITLVRRNFDVYTGINETRLVKKDNQGYKGGTFSWTDNLTGTVALNENNYLVFGMMPVAGDAKGAYTLNSSNLTFRL